MNKPSQILKVWKQKIVRNWSVDEAFRYLAIVDRIQQQKIKLGSVLEVGSGDLGITPYLKNVEITGLDQSFSDRPSTLQRVVGSATNLPFADNSFDTVLTVDCLEHIPHHLYNQVFAEMFRVAKKQVIISLPCDKAAYEMDKSLDRYYLNKFGQRHHFLEEHVNNGQINQSDIYNHIQDGLLINHKSGKISSWPVMNIGFRHFYLMFGLQQAIFSRIIYSFLLVLVPFRRLLNFGNRYWRLFIVKINSKYEE